MPAEPAAFYSTAAQVLPVVFLPIAFEQGFWRRTEASRVFGLETGGIPQGKFVKAAAVLMIVLPVDLFVGEWFALASVDGNEPDVARYFVTGALIQAGIIGRLARDVDWSTGSTARPTDERSHRLRPRASRNRDAGNRECGRSRCSASCSPFSERE
jgi:hypothetical protein